MVPGSRTGVDGEVVDVPLPDEPPVGNEEDELPEFTLEELLEPPPPKIPPKSGANCPRNGITKLKILFRKLKISLKTVNTLSKNPFTLSPKLGSGASGSATSATSVVGWTEEVSDTELEGAVEFWVAVVVGTVSVGALV